MTATASVQSTSQSTPYGVLCGCVYTHATSHWSRPTSQFFSTSHCQGNFPNARGDRENPIITPSGCPIHRSLSQMLKQTKKKDVSWSGDGAPTILFRRINRLCVRSPFVCSFFFFFYFGEVGEITHFHGHPNGLENTERRAHNVFVSFIPLAHCGG